MKIRYFRKRAIRKARRAEQRRNEKQEYKERIAKWHSTFVIWPRVLHTPEDGAEYATRAFFETIWQKGRIVNNVGIGSYDETIWIRHTDKDYFMKKLDGTLEPEENFDNGIDMGMVGGATQGPPGGQ